MHEGHRERMWDRLYFHGDSMSDHELLETLLFYALPRVNTNPAAHALLDSFGNLERLFSAQPAELEKVAGVGKKTAELIYLVGQMMRRVRAREGKGVRLKNSAEVRLFAAGRFLGKKEEVLEVYCLGTGGSLLCVKSFPGGDDKSVTLRSRTLSGVFASVQPLSVIVAHNHPSGKCEPSDEDDEAAREIYRVCLVNGVQLSDCMIFADGQPPYSYFLSDRFSMLGIGQEGKERTISVGCKSGGEEE